MRTKASTLPALGALVLALTGCVDLVGGEQIIHGGGAVITETRSTGRFTGVSNSTSARVEILQANTERVWVRAEESLQPYIRTRVEGGVLRIFVDANVRLQPREPIVVLVDVHTLTDIRSSGSGEIYAPVLDARRLQVEASGAGDVRLPSLLADSLIILHSGSGDVTATGDVLRLRFMQSGAGRIDTRELQTNEATATISGSGGAVIRVRQRLTATLSGSGGLRYYGSPTVTQTVTGSGRVDRVGS
jgi:hypothetical protein